MSWKDILKKEYMFRDVDEFARYMVGNNIKNAQYVLTNVTEIMKLPKEQQDEKLTQLTNAITREDDLRMAWIELLNKGKGFRNGYYGDLE
jgi:hypothetical protein